MADVDAHRELAVIALPTNPQSFVTVMLDVAPGLGTPSDVAAKVGELYNAYGNKDFRGVPTVDEFDEVAFNDSKPLPPNPPEADPYLVTWDGPNDPENPKNWSQGYKWFITIIAAFITVTVTLASSAPTTATLALSAEFGSSLQISLMVTSIFLLGYILGPILWGPGSELYGRRPVYIFTLTFFTLFFLGQALARNMSTVLATRFFGGVFGAGPLVVCGGTIADIWDPVGRGQAASVFAASVFLGPVLGPIIGGFILESSLGWRWIFLFLMVFGGICTFIAITLLPETNGAVILKKKAMRLRALSPDSRKAQLLYAAHERQDRSLKGIVQVVLYRPFHMLLMEPILVLITVYLSLVYGILYALFEAYPIIFMFKRRMSISQTGLMFLPVGLGTTLGAVLNVLFTRHYPMLLKQWKGFPPPEQRLFGAMLAGPSLVFGILWLGWTGEYDAVPWGVPALSGLLLGMSVSLIFISFLAYILDTYLVYSASAFAANTMVRSAVGAAFPLFTVQMFTKLGVNGAATLLGMFALVLSPSPFLFYKYGARIRQSSKFAPCTDLQIAKELKREEVKRNIQVVQRV